MEEIEQVRALIGDDDSDNQAFPDSTIETILQAFDGNLLRVAASLLERAAVEEALRYKIIKTDDLSVDGTGAAKILLAQAKAYREQADRDEDEAEATFEVVYPMSTKTDRSEYMDSWPWVSV